METRTVEVFRFAELGDSAKERARYEAQASGIWDFYAEEALESLFAFLRYFRAKLLDYRIDWTNCSHSYIRIDLPWYEEGESDDPIVVGEFSLRRVGRGFSRNGNGGVIHVAHMAECREAQTEADARAAADRERRFGGVETPAAMVPPKQERAMKVQDLIFVLKAVDAAFGVLSAHPAFAGDADEAPEFNEGGVGYQATEMVREALEGQEPEVLRKYRALHDGLSEMVEEGRLTRDMIPDDYHWLVETLAELAVLDPVGKE